MNFGITSLREICLFSFCLFVCFCYALSHNTDLNVPQEKFSARPTAFQTHISLFFHSTIEICVARNVCARVAYIN